MFSRLAPNTIWTSPLSLAALLFAAATLSYHLVEKPLRHRAWSAGQRFDLVFSLMAVTVAIGFLSILSSLPAKPVALSASALSLEQPFLLLPSGDPYNPTCVVDDQQRLLEADTFDKCTFPPASGSGAPTVWTIGDSHAGHFNGLLIGLHQDLGIGIHLVETPGQFFPPSANANPASRLALMDDMRKQIRPNDVVFLSRLYLTRSDPPTVFEDVATDWASALESFLQEMAEKSIRVVISGPPPSFTFPDIRACDRDNPSSCGIPRAQLATQVSEVEAVLDDLANRHENVRVLRVFDILCPKSQLVCVPVKDGVFTMRDSDHLNVYGADLLRDSFLDAIGFARR